MHKVVKSSRYLLSVRQGKTAGSEVGINSYTVLFTKTCVHPCHTIRIHNALHYWRQMEYNVFGIRIGRVRMHSMIVPLLLLVLPEDFSWCVDSSVIVILFLLNVISYITLNEE
jgi:hypothetical protein